MTNSSGRLAIHIAINTETPWMAGGPCQLISVGNYIGHEPDINPTGIVKGINRCSQARICFTKHEMSQCAEI
jgi:hypothetical protein